MHFGVQNIDKIYVCWGFLKPVEINCFSNLYKRRTNAHVHVVLAISDSAAFVKDQFGLGAGNLIHFTLAVKYVLFAPAFKILWDCINFLPNQRSILSGKW